MEAVSSIRIVMEKVLSNKKQSINEVVDVNEVSRIAHGTVLVGDLSSVNDIRVDGKVDGTLFSQGKIVVGEKAVLKGAMLCNSTDFWGRMEGNIYVRELLSIKSTANINGEIRAKKFQVEMGASINGIFKMISEDDFDKDCKSVVKADIPVEE